MTIDDLEETAELYVKKHPGCTPHTFLNKIRKNLILLLCQADVTEITGTIDSFGGKEETGSSISKGIFNLLCLSTLLGADLNSAICSIAEQVKKSFASSPPESAADSVSGAGQHTETQNDSNGNNEKIEMYRNALKNCNSPEERKKIWKEIVEDKELGNKDKFTLQKEMKEIEKRLK